MLSHVADSVSASQLALLCHATSAVISPYRLVHYQRSHISHADWSLAATYHIRIFIVITFLYCLVIAQYSHCTNFQRSARQEIHKSLQYGLPGPGIPRLGSADGVL